jgi:ABC-type transporter Mla subunit MlaD
MDLPTEVKTRLSECLKGELSLDAFREWFADVQRTANQQCDSTRKLIFALGYTIALFASGRTNSTELRQSLQTFADQLENTVQISYGRSPSVQQPELCFAYA